MVAEFEDIVKPHGVAISALVPSFSSDNQMMYVNYGFDSMEHWGIFSDAMLKDEKMPSTQTRAAEIAVLKASSEILVVA